MTINVRLSAVFVAAMSAALFSAVPAITGDGGDYPAMVESLNAGSRDRAAVVETIFNVLRGPDAPAMRDALHYGLFEGNFLVQTGGVEALAMAGATQDIDAIQTLLEINDSLPVKAAIIQLIPAFVLVGQERSRLAYIRHVDADSRRFTASSGFEPLHRPPLNRRGRYDGGQAVLRGRVYAILVRQFDPVNAAFDHIFDPRHGGAARATVRHYVGEALGNDPSAWRDIWRNHSTDITPVSADEIEEIRLTALAAVADLAVGYDQTVVDGFDVLFAADNPTIPQASLETLAAMCRATAIQANNIQSGLYGDLPGEPEQEWRRRFFADARHLWLYANRKARDNTTAASENLALAAIDCLGASAAIPGFIKREDAELSAMAESAVAALGFASLQPEIPERTRLALLRALGEIASSPSVGLIRELLMSAYAGTERGRDGLAVAEAAVAALTAIAASDTDGSGDARALLLRLLEDEREYPAAKPGVPPVRMGHIVMWRLQRLASSSEATLDSDYWRSRLDWQ